MLAVAGLGVTLLLIRVFLASERVLGWILTAAVVAGLLHPAVSVLQTRMRRGLAVGVVAVATLTLIGLTAFGLTSAFVRETRHLQAAAPRAAEAVERSGRFAEAARELKFAERTRRFVDEVPARLRGGTPAEAFRAAATRGVAFLATGVLALFLLLHGPRLAESAAAQIGDATRRARLVEVAPPAYRRAFTYATGTLAMALVAGLLTYAVASVTGVPGPAPLGLWAAMWDAVPILGLTIGAVPVVLLAALASPARGLLAAALLIGYQAFEATVLQPRVEVRSIRLGPFLTVGAGLVGLEMYGLGGALLVPLAVALLIAIADELRPLEGSTSAAGAPTALEKKPSARGRTAPPPGQSTS